MSSPVFMVLRLLRDPEVSNKVIFKFALRQVKAMGYAKVASMVLGALMVSASSVIKVPQIRKITLPNTAQERMALASGISANSVKLETLGQFVHVTFNKQSGNSFINYGESLLLGLQNVALLLILEYYELRRQAKGEKDAVAAKMALRAARIAAALLFIVKIAPRGLIEALQLTNIPIGMAAKILQIRRNAALRSTKHLSKVTIGANVVGSMVRVFTTVSNFRRSSPRDRILLAGYSSSLALNAYIAAQMIQFREEQLEKED